MNHVEASTKSQLILQYRDRFSRSSTGCHVVAAVIVIGLSFSITWVWNNSLLFSGDRIHSPEQIEDALSLISDSKKIRLRHETLVSQSVECQAKSQDITAWLPETLDWEKAESSVEQLAAESGVLLIDLQKDKEHMGARVAVLAATCQVKGSFEGICRFLHELSQVEAPVWCDGIAMERNSLRGDGVSECDATLTLRFPSRGQQTIAGKLASLGDPNAT